MLVTNLSESYPTIFKKDKSFTKKITANLTVYNNGGTDLFMIRYNLDIIEFI